MTTKGIRRKIEWTPEDRARHQAIREMFKNWHPGLEELLATGEFEGPIRQGAFWALRQAMDNLKKERERKHLTLADVAEISGIDSAAISRLESGAQANPTIFTILRYADALGKQLVWDFEDVPQDGLARNGRAVKTVRKRKNPPVRAAKAR